MAYDAVNAQVVLFEAKTTLRALCPTHGCGWNELDTKESNDRSLGAD